MPLDRDVTVLAIGRVAELLAHRCPDLVVDRVEALGEGDFCEVYLVNDEMVVRIAKHAEAAESLAREACLLPRIADVVDSSVPLPEVVSPAPRPAFNAHPLVPGPALTRA